MNQLVPFASPQLPDPKIEQSLSKTAEFLREYTPFPESANKDIFAGQYQIDLTTPLPQFNAPNARAFAATDLNDDKQLLAMVCDPGSIQRHNMINRMLLLRHPNICSLVAAGTVELSQPAEERFVVFYERTKGQKLSVLLASANGKIPANIIISRIIAPITQAILTLQEMGIMHGSINPENIYYDNEAILGPCVLEPCGYSQPYYYELVERMQSHPAGKSDFYPGADFYALGVLVLQTLLGKQWLERSPASTLTRVMLRQGPFMALTAGRETPEEFTDFLWGMLGSGSSQRWTYRYLKPWLDGKHYNLVSSSPPTEGAKPYECFGTTGHSRREVAHLMRNNWDKVQEALGQASLSQWILVTLRQKDLSEMVARHIKIIVESGNKNENLRNDHIMRLIIMLDDLGPLQYGKAAFQLDGIGTMLADLYVKQSQEELALLAKFIEQNLIAGWAEIQFNKEIEIPEATSQLITKLERMRVMLRNHGLGFGVERVMYDLNPEMPCMSPLCRGKHITALTPLLKHLDKIAPNMAGGQDPIDVHIAAFMASKLAIANEIHLYDIAAIPALAQNKALTALKLFAVAQHRSGNIELAGLTHWVAQRVLPSLQHLHSHTIRGRTLQMLLDQAMDGRTQTLSDLLLDGEIVNVDQTGYQKAQTNYKRNADRIEHYRKGLTLDYDSAQLGNVIAKIFAYMALLMSISNIFLSYQ